MNKNQKPKEELTFVKASLFERIIASILDGILLWVVTTILNNTIGLPYLWGFKLSFLYNILFVSWKGATLGKLIMKIKVVTTSYEKVNGGRAVVRELLGRWISDFTQIGYLAAFIDTKRQALHDKIAQTYVVKVDADGNLIEGKDKPISMTDIVLLVLATLSSSLILFNMYIGNPVQISGKSMQPNFAEGEYYMVNEVKYRFNSPQRGEVIVYVPPKEAGCPAGISCRFTGRIIGIPGDTISVKDGAIFINGEAEDNSFLMEGIITVPGKATKDAPIILKENEYFIAADNRPYASDSRQWGPIKRSDIVGEMWFRYWPIEKK